MIDTTSVITQVKYGKQPSYWGVYYGQSNPGCFFIYWKHPITTALVILPEGAVQWDINNEENMGSLSFSDIQSVQLAGETRIVGYDGDINSRSYYWLDIYNNNGTYVKWPFSNGFNDAASIGKAIIAAYNYYWR